MAAAAGVQRPPFFDVGVEFGLFQQLLDLLPAPPGVGQGQGVQGGLPQGDGDALVVHHVDLPAVVLRQHLGRLAGAAQAAGHGDVDHLVILLQEFVPEGQHVAGGGLGGGDVGPLGQLLVELLLGEGDVLQEELLVDVEGHGEHKNAQFLRLGLGDAAVAVGGNGNFTHTEPLFGRAPEGAEGFSR